MRLKLPAGSRLLLRVIHRGCTPFSKTPAVVPGSRRSSPRAAVNGVRAPNVAA